MKSVPEKEMKDKSAPASEDPLPNIPPPSAVALISSGIAGAVKGAAIGGLGTALLVLLSRPLVAIFLRILGATTPHGEIAKIGDTVVQWKTMADYPFPDLEVFFGCIGGLVGCFLGARIAPSLLRDKKARQRSQAAGKATAKKEIAAKGYSWAVTILCPTCGKGQPSGRAICSECGSALTNNTGGGARETGEQA